MPIKVGDRLPEASFMTFTAEGPAPTTTDEVFAGKTVALFAVPGAYTPTCSARHLPGFRERADDLRAKGVDKIVCTAVNDVFVLGAWAKQEGVTESIQVLADGNAAFAQALGLEMDASKFGMGLRSQRYSMLVEDGTVRRLNVEEGGAFEVSSAEHLIAQI